MSEQSLHRHEYAGACAGRRFLLLFLLTLVCAPLRAQQKDTPRARKPETLETSPALVIGRMRHGESGVAELRGRASFSVGGANADDTVTGTLVYNLPESERQKLATLTGRALKDIPATLSASQVSASFQSETACPAVQLEFSPLSLDIAGGSLQITRFVLSINESSREITRLFCLWTTQINHKRARRGVITRINALLSGTADDDMGR
ncbi:MAG: hypothetical protein ACKV2V_06710 [Blastocatellia bacterium]